MISEPGDRPNLLLFGVGHSGTSVVAKMLGALGWNLGEADGFGEDVPVRRLNEQLRQGRPADPRTMTQTFRRLASPWLVKDPRFVLTLREWMPVFATWPPAERPVLLFMTRDIAKVERTYEAYGELKNGSPGMYGRTVRELAALASEGYQAWPDRKIHFEFEQIIEAGRLFNVNRATRRDTVAGGS